MFAIKDYKAIYEYRNKRQARVDGKRWDAEWEAWKKGPDDVGTEADTGDEETVVDLYVAEEDDGSNDFLDSISREAEMIKLFADSVDEVGEQILERCIESIQKTVMQMTAKQNIANADSAFFAGELDENIGERNVQYPDVQDFRERRERRKKERREDEEDWVTIKGTHVLIDENGVAQGGGKLKGMTFERAKSNKRERPAENGGVRGVRKATSVQERGEEVRKIATTYNDAYERISKAEIALLFGKRSEKELKEISEEEKEVDRKEKEISDRYGGKTPEQIEEEVKKMPDEIEKYLHEIEEKKRKRKLNIDIMTEEESDKQLAEIIELKEKKNSLETKLYDGYKALGEFNDVKYQRRKLDERRKRAEKEKKEYEDANVEIERAKREQAEALEQFREYIKVNPIEFEDCETGYEVEMLAAAKSGEKYDVYHAVAMISGSCNRGGVEYRKAEKRKGEISEEEIIGSVGGGDRTDGSCASAALAYVANKCGYEVRDFRGGKSQGTFAAHISTLVESAGGKILKKDNDVESGISLLHDMEPGKEYYFFAGRHVAIVRSNNSGPVPTMEYLELQSDGENGWRPLGRDELEWRFGCANAPIHDETGTHIQESGIIGLDELAGNKEVMAIMGFVNTADDQQKKGRGGHEK